MAYLGLVHVLAGRERRENHGFGPMKLTASQTRRHGGLERRARCSGESSESSEVGIAAWPCGHWPAAVLAPEAVGSLRPGFDQDSRSLGPADSVSLAAHPPLRSARDVSLNDER